MPGPATLDEPLARVLELDSRPPGVAAWLGYGSTSVMLLEGLAVLALLLASARPRAMVPAMQVQEAEIRTDDLPAPPLETMQPSSGVHSPRPPSRSPSAPANARAPRIVAQDALADDPVDLTATPPGNSETSPATPPDPGTGDPATPPLVDTPGSDPARDRRPRRAISPAPDRSCPASLGGAGEWRCPFPEEADAAQLDDAFVTLQVDVADNGSPTGVRVLGDPGSGFGREARRCAMGQRYATALDRDGTPVAGTTRPFRVHFSR